MCNTKHSHMDKEERYVAERVKFKDGCCVTAGDDQGRHVPVVGPPPSLRNLISPI